MIRKVLLSLALLALSAVPAWAAPGTNAIGVFFDQTATSNCAPSQAPYSTLTAYVLAVNVSQVGGVSGWEATILINPTTFSAGITMDIGAEALNVLVPPVFQVGYAVKRTGNPIVLLTISTFYLGGDIAFGLGPCVPSSFGDMSPGYADGDDASILVPLYQDSNVVPWTLPIYRGSNTDERLPDTGPPHSFLVAGVGGATCPTALEAATWGGVKNLYK